MKLHGKEAVEPAFATTPFGCFVMLGGARGIIIHFSKLLRSEDVVVLG